MSLSVENLSCTRGGLPVLTGVTFHVDPGEALILRGPNGAGKTTLLRTLAGLAPALFGGIAVSEDSIAYSGHADGLKAQLSVAENLRFWADVFRAPGIDAAVDAFDLGELMDRRAGNLSAGQKRRLSLARMLVTGRAIWCMDEPTVSLDSENVARFAAAVKQHLSNGGLAVIATHIDLGLPEARALDIAPFMASQIETDPSDDPFLAEDTL